MLCVFTWMSCQQRRKARLQARLASLAGNPMKAKGQGREGMPFPKPPKTFPAWKLFFKILFLSNHDPVHSLQTNTICVNLFLCLAPKSTKIRIFAVSYFSTQHCSFGLSFPTWKKIRTFQKSTPDVEQILVHLGTLTLPLLILALIIFPVVCLRVSCREVRWKV